MVWLLLKDPTPSSESSASALRLARAARFAVPGGISWLGTGHAVVHLNPGRIAVGTLDYQQLRTQFALADVAAVYPSVCDAEISEGDRPGFTLSMHGEFHDGEGTVYREGVLFCQGVRPA